MDILLEALDPLAVLRQGMIKRKTYTRIDRMEYMLHYIIKGVAMRRHNRGIWKSECTTNTVF